MSRDGQQALELRPSGYFEDAEWIGIGWQLSDSNGEVFHIKHSVTKNNKFMLPEVQLGDHALIAILLYAMKHAKSLHVNGIVSPKLLDGLYTLQSIWSRWRPELYRQIEITAEAEQPSSIKSMEEGAIFAFSGGVDATFSLFRHLTGMVGRCSRQPDAAMLVQGMDIPLDRDDYFYGALKRAELILESTSVKLIPIKTNSRQLDQSWEDSFSLQLASCFFLLQKKFRWAMLGSGEPYESLSLPWGSTPLTDYLVSNESLSLIFDGANFDRTEKVDWLVKNTRETTVSNIRVCYAGSKKDRNCGKCEKCIRTKLNFWAKGHKVPSAFDTSLSISQVILVKTKNKEQIYELERVCKHAKINGFRKTPIYWALKFGIFRSYIIIMLKNILKFLKRNKNRLCKYLGV